MLSDKISLKQVNIIWMLPSGIFSVYLRGCLWPPVPNPIQIFFSQIDPKNPNQKINFNSFQ